MAPFFIAPIPPNEGARDAGVGDALVVDSSRALLEAAPPRCAPEAGLDEPDDTFADTDCDGIDGNAEHAVFVAPTGSDTSAGTKAEPVKTIGKAIGVAAASGRSVYVCNGEYAENVRIEQTGIRIYGGYDCEHEWQRGTDRALVAPPSGVPLVIADVIDAVVVDRLSFHAANADPAAYGSSAIAVAVRNSAEVLLRRSVLRAGDAAHGADGEPVQSIPRQTIAAAGTSVGAMDCVGTLNGTLLQGSPPECLTVAQAGVGGTRPCKGVAVQGGWGGDGANIVRGVKAQPGRFGLPLTGIGPNDTSGADGAPGVASVSGFGTIQSGTYVGDNTGTAGSDGSAGKAGFGGKGGDSLGSGDLVTTFWIGGGGGQGGYPGCGGSGGKPGSGGGGSFALLSDHSHVRIERALLETGRGGDGGAGSDGAHGQLGGPGGPGGTGSGRGVTDGHPGEDGGNGGNGGSGGPGGGGPSVGIAWSGAPPSVDGVTFVLGTPGLGGVSFARIGAQGVVAEVHPPVPSGDAGQGGTQ